MSDMTQHAAVREVKTRESFGTRGAFILAAIGSAVGLGNIWRFPYVAYENGGGAFIIPYLIALLTAGIPLLFFDYAIGHRFKGSPPLAFRRLHKATEPIGWFQVLINFVIAVYYAAIIGWAAMYTYYAIDQKWGDDPKTFFQGNFLQVSENIGVEFNFVANVFPALAVVWVLLLIIIGLGVRRGVAKASLVGIPVLVVMFLVLVIVSLTLPGAELGLDALFKPDWSILSNPSVWIAAYGQIFFSLSIGFGIMITYSSYLKRRTNLTGSGLVVGFSNSAFEILAAIGVFAALGFMAQASNTPVSELAVAGPGLAFVIFPLLISQLPAGPLGFIVGVLFFASIVFAGLTSLISIVEVVVSAVKDKTGLSRWASTLIIGVPCAVLSLLLLGTTTGLYVLDVTDAFVNNIGIVGAAFIAVLVISWVVRRLPALRDHLNSISSFRVGRVWMTMISIVMPVVLGYLLVSDLIAKIQQPYDEYPVDFIAVFGWGMIIVMIILSVALTVMPWSKKSALQAEASHEDELAHEHGRHRAAEDAEALLSNEEEVTP